LGLKGLPIKSDILKKSGAKAVMDDSTETERKLEKLTDMPAVDMSMPDVGSVGENLEVDDDDEEANKIDEELKARAKDAMEVDDDDDDPLDAFMNGVKEEVQKVNEIDKMKKKDDPASRRRQEERINEDGDVEEEPEVVEDELDATNLNPEDILALAAKKAKKKDLASVDHARVTYEPFRKEFYHPPPEISEMTDEGADLLRLAFDGIKIRGIDCPRPVTKWSHCGLPASV
jgi:ATP-dependent RNA helicase DDX46/PRP5